MEQKVQKTQKSQKSQMLFLKFQLIILLGFFFGVTYFEQYYSNIFFIYEDMKENYWFFLTHLDVTEFSFFKIFLFFSSWGTINSYIRNLNEGHQSDFIDLFFIKGTNKIKTVELSIPATLLYDTFRICVCFSLFIYGMFSTAFSVTFNSLHDLNFIPTGEEEYRGIVMNILIACSIFNTFMALKFKSNKEYKITPLFLMFGFLAGIFYVCIINHGFEKWSGADSTILNADIYIVYDFIFAGLLVILGIIGILRFIDYIETRDVNGQGTLRERDLAKRKKLLAIPSEERTFRQKIFIEDTPDETHEYKTLKESMKFGNLDYASLFLFTIASSISIIGIFSAFKGTIDVNNTTEINGHTVNYRDHNAITHESNSEIVEGFIEHYLGGIFISTDSNYEITYLGKIAHENNKHEEFIKAISITELNYIKNKEAYREQILNYKYDKPHDRNQDLIKKQMNDILVGLTDFQYLKQFHNDILDGNYQKAVDEYQAVLNADHKRKEGLSKDELRTMDHYDSIYSSHIFALLNETGLAKVDQTVNSTESHIAHFQKFDTQKENIDDYGDKLQSTKEDLDRILDLFL